MADRIKGITVEIGGDTKGLSKALSNVNKEISTTQKDLKDVERLLKLDPGNTELLRQKYDLLNKSIESTETKLDSLKDAEKQLQAQFQRGDIGEDQYNACLLYTSVQKNWKEPQRGCYFAGINKRNTDKKRIAEIKKDLFGTA